jgi:hypothetical protein
LTTSKTQLDFEFMLTYLLCQDFISEVPNFSLTEVPSGWGAGDLILPQPNEADVTIRSIR